MNILRNIAIPALMVFAINAAAQTSSNSGVTRRDGNSGRTSQSSSEVSTRMQSFYGTDGSLSDADVQWMRVIYRQLDLNDPQNAPLYFPEDPIEGQENLFRIIMRLICDGKINAWEYLDGREVFTDQYQINPVDVFDRFHIIYNTARGSTERNPRYEIDESDVPTNEVLTYYIIERWEYDTRTNRMKTYIEAICPVLHRAGDFGGDAVRYPMFWVKYADLRPYLAQQPIFVSDHNNLPTCTYDDFFNLTMYNGAIYKTRNLRNLSLMQMYPDPDDLKHAQDSIQLALEHFEDKLWVPDREEVIARREQREAAAAAAGPDLSEVVAAPEGSEPAATPAEPAATPAKTSPRKTTRGKKESKPASTRPASSSSSSSGATRSVRRRK